MLNYYLSCYIVTPSHNGIFSESHTIGEAILSILNTYSPLKSKNLAIGSKAEHIIPPTGKF